MLAADLELVEQCFTEAVVLHPREREAYLARVCGSNDVLRQRVLVLIAAHESTGDFLPVPGPRAEEGTQLEGPGSIIGNYRLIEVLGEGGFGVVFRAEQQKPVQREVALKIIKWGMDTRQVIRRFEAERQALARMDHPNIAKVLDAGATERGRPYFVMELAEGRPITRYCDEEKLGIDERLELFVQVCDAVQHAHQKGLIHRDLKPSNVIVTERDGKPVPKVIDFGIAKATQGKLTDQTLVTESRQLMGTPAYMSPEQASFGDLDVDTRSDIYSLGVVLYELLVGVTPFTAAELSGTGGRVRQVIGNVDPPRPSVRWSGLGEKARQEGAASRLAQPERLGKKLRGELDWIVMKCLEKDRARRYETASELARDLERYERDEPIEASPPSSLYVLKTFARRHRVLLQVSGVAALLLVMASVVSVWMAIRATQAEKQRAAAEQQAVLSLVDMYMSKGLENETAAHNGQSLLWFAKAASLVPADSESAKANLVRFKNWSYGQWKPVAAVKSPGGDRVAFNPVDARYLLVDARYIAPASARFWDLKTEKEVRLPKEWGEAQAAAWSEDGSAIAGSQTGEVVCFQIADMSVSSRISIGKPVASVVLNAKTSIAAAASGNEIYVWNTKQPGPPATYTHTGVIRHIALSRDGHLLLTADESMHARVFAVGQSSDSTVHLSGPVVDVHHVLRVDGKMILPVFTLRDAEVLVLDEPGTREIDGALKWYDATNGSVKGQMRDRNLWNIRHLFPSADGAFVAVASGNGYLLDSSKHQAVQAISDMTVMAFDANPPLLIQGSSFAVTARSFASRKIGDAALPELGAPAGVRAFSVSGDGWQLAVLQPDGVAQVWRMPSPEDVPAHPLALNGTGTWLAFSRDGKYVAPVGTMDGRADLLTLQVSDTATGKPVGSPLPLGATLLSAAFSYDGNRFFTASGTAQEEKRLQFWDWRSGKEVCSYVALPSEPMWLACAPDDGAVAVQCAGGTLLLINPKDGHLIWRAQCGALRQAGGGDDPHPYLVGSRGTVQFSRDGARIVTSGSPVVEAWDRATGKRLFEIRHDANCWAVAESPDGRVLATGSEDRMVRLADAATGEPVGEPLAHPRAVGGIEFSKDGSRFLTVCYDNETRIWETRTQQLLQTIEAPGKVAAARFTSDGRRVLETSFAAFRVLDAQTGYPLTPALGAPGFHIHVDLTPDDRWAAVAGSIQLPGGNVYNPLIFDVAALSAPYEKGQENAELWAELLSCGRLNGSTYVRLSNGEWMERWARYRAAHGGAAF